MTRVPTTSAGAPLRRRLLAVLVAVLAATAVVAPQPAASATGAARHAVVDPGLLAAVGGTAVPAILAWDGDTASRAGVLAELDETGLAHRAFSHLDMAVACVATRDDVDALAAITGAVSVWGDEPLVPTVEPDVLATALRSSPASAVAGGAAAQLGTADLDVTGEGVGIAVLDTGIDGRHPDLAYGPRTVLNTRVIVSHYEILGVGEDTCAPDTFQEDVEDSETTSGHGTALAGVAAGDGSAGDGAVVGVAPGADLVGVSVVEQVTPQYEGEAKVSLIRFIAGVNHTLSNTLVGGPTTAKVALVGWTREGLYDPFHPHFLAIRDLWDFGIVPVLPAGNGGPQTSDCSRAETCTFNPMAVGTSVIAVGAATTDLDALEDFSSRGDPVERQTRGQWVSYEPTLVAPGAATTTFRAGTGPLGTPAGTTPYPVAGSGTGNPAADPHYQAMAGTSIAAAHVAGVIALMQEAAADVSGCFLQPWQVKYILQLSADQMPGYQRHEVGAGALDVVEALEMAADQDFYGGNNPWDCAG